MTVRGQSIITEAHSAIELALAGVGLAYVFEPLVEDDIDCGRLVQVLASYSVEEAGLFLYFPRRAQLAAEAPSIH